MDIGIRIKNIRTAKGLRGNEVAKKAFISQSYLSDIENGRTTPSLDKLSTICDALEISLAELFLTSKNNRKLTVLPVRNLTSIMSSYLFLRKEKDIPHDV
ncbi:helix-turn-helix domain-containing protein [Weizmannia agrestimuris]|uniref:helix-turn-helix domain-containing protein n=1 Tax=Weizmannia agrestimuris TaxID=2941342 RepID=UPI0034633CD1